MLPAEGQGSAAVYAPLFAVEEADIDQLRMVVARYQQCRQVEEATKEIRKLEPYLIGLDSELLTGACQQAGL